MLSKIGKIVWFKELFLSLILFNFVVACSSSSNQEETQNLRSSYASDWMELAYAIVRDEGLAPPSASRSYAYTGVALYESVVHGFSNLNSLEGQLNGLEALPQPTSEVVYDWPAVMATVAANMTQYLFAPYSEDTHVRISDLQSAQLADRRDAGVTEDIIVRSTEYGNELAVALTAWAEFDGYSDIAALSFEMPECDSCWVPTGPVNAPLEPHWGLLRTFALENSASCAPLEHEPYSEEPGSSFYNEALAVYETSLELTEEQVTIARYWADNPRQTGTPPGHWVRIAGTIINQNNLNLERAVETYARVGIALGDAFISCWHTKYQYSLLRPQTYIQRHINPDWTSLVPTPPFPEYTSGHSTVSGASAEVLNALFGAVTFVDNANADLGFDNRSFSSFYEAADEAALSRLYGGIHYPMGNNQGITQGLCIGASINERVQTR